MNTQEQDDDYIGSIKPRKLTMKLATLFATLSIAVLTACADGADTPLAATMPAAAVPAVAEQPAVVAEDAAPALAASPCVGAPEACGLMPPQLPAKEGPACAAGDRGCSVDVCAQDRNCGKTPARPTGHKTV
jgi:hypothetical protein